MPIDLLDWIKAELSSQPEVLEVIEPVLRRARLTYGGDTVYVRTPRPEVVSRRTVQRRLRAERAAL